MSPDRIALDFRSRYLQNRDDLAAFDAAFRAQDFTEWATDRIRDWCYRWWEERLMGRDLDRAERQIHGARGEN